MKKLLTVFLLFFLFSCDHPSVDLSLPDTDTSLFISGNIVTFPKGTNAIDIYNTIVFLYPDSEWHNVTGEWKRINTVTDKDGLLTQAWQVIKFSKIRHTKTEVKLHPNNSGLVYTHTVSLYRNDTSIRTIEYQWQTFNGNTQKTELKNPAIEGDIIFTF